MGKDWKGGQEIKNHGGGEGEAIGGTLGMKITPIQSFCKSFLVMDRKTKKYHLPLQIQKERSRVKINICLCLLGPNSNTQEHLYLVLTQSINQPQFISTSTIQLALDPRKNSRQELSPQDLYLCHLFIQSPKCTQSSAGEHAKKRIQWLPFTKYFSF